MLLDEERVKMSCTSSARSTASFHGGEKAYDGRIQEKTGMKDLRGKRGGGTVRPRHNMLMETKEMKLRGFESTLLESPATSSDVHDSPRRKGPVQPGGDRDLPPDNGQSSIVVNNIRMFEKIKERRRRRLTGLYNHRYFQEQLEKEYSRARRLTCRCPLSCGHRPLQRSQRHVRPPERRHDPQGFATILRRACGTST